MTDQVTATLETLKEVQKEVNDTKTDEETNKKDLQDTRSELQKNQDNIQQLKDEVQDLKKRQHELDKQQERQEDHNNRNDIQRDRQEVLNRRSNVLFYGIPEKTGRGRERSDEVVIGLLNDYMPEGEWKDSDCVNAYRAGRWGGSDRARDRPRPIVETFDKPSDVGFILKNKQGRENMKKDGFGCGQDLTRQQKQTLDSLRSEGKTAYYSRGRLVVRDPNHDLRSRSRQDNEERRSHRQHIKIALADGMDIDMETDPGSDDGQSQPIPNPLSQLNTDDDRSQDMDSYDPTRGGRNANVGDNMSNRTYSRPNEQYQQTPNRLNDRNRDRSDKFGARQKTFRFGQNFRYSRRDTPPIHQYPPPRPPQPAYPSDQSRHTNNPASTSNTAFFPQAPSFAQFQQMQNFFSHLNEFVSQNQRQQHVPSPSRSSHTCGQRQAPSSSHPPPPHPPLL